jgi:DNA-binding PadR family transcriptional regulator
MAKPLTPLALTVLRMLCDGPMHPYEMQQRIRQYAYDHAVKVTHGALYNSVERLAARGLIETVETSREGRRPERTVYRVTDAGRSAAQLRLAEILSELNEEFPLFGTGLAFVNLLPENEVHQCLLTRLNKLEFLLAGHQTAYEALLKRGLPRYKLLDMELAIGHNQVELEYVRGLIDDLENGRLDWAEGSSTACRPPDNLRHEENS